MEVKIAIPTWLTSTMAAEWLKRTDVPADPVQRMRFLRKHLSPEQAHAVAEQRQLREAAVRKFSHPERMLFTDKGLQQATEERLSFYKAQRFAEAAIVADLCCGIGGDALGLAARGLRVHACDRDETSAALAKYNLTKCFPTASFEVYQQDATGFDVSAYDAWHIDPDRRPREKRTTQLEFFQPDLENLEKLRRANPHAAIKLAPATVAPPGWQAEGELEWISCRSECRQQVAWLGGLTSQAGQRRATLVGPDFVESLTGSPQTQPPQVAEVRRFIIEPDPAILAADLLGQFAVGFGLAMWSPEVVYLTADEPPNTALGQVFRIEEALPFDLKRLKQALKARRIGRVEVKKRAFPSVDPARLQKQLRNPGSETATLLLAPYQGHVTAFLTQRVALGEERQHR